MASIMVTLPLQLLCQLIGNSNESICGTAVNQSSLHIEPAILPHGYIAHSDIGVALKVYNHSVSWMVARKQCELDGANLAVVDSYTKLSYILQHREFSGSTHVGILRMYDDEKWVGVVDSMPVLSIPWAQGEPNHPWDCVVILEKKNLLGNLPCITLADYACEIPIPNDRIVQRSSIVGQISIS